MEMRAPKDKLTLAAEQNIKEKNYWLNKLSGDLTKSTFPYDYQMKKIEKYRPGRVKFRFPGKLYAKTMELSNGVDVKVHMILVTGLFILLDKYMNDNNDIIIGSPILKQDIQGEFVNTVLVFRNQVEGHTGFKELLLQVRETIINANENQNYPLEILLNQLNLPLKPGEFSLFDVVVLMENLHDKCYIQGIPYNMMFSFLKTDGHIEGFVEYNSLLYIEGTVKRMINHYIQVLDQGLFNLDLPLSRLELLSLQEKTQILCDFNSQSLDYPKDNALHELFAQQVESTPNHIALVGQIPNPKSQIPNPKQRGVIRTGFKRLRRGASFAIVSISPGTFHPCVN